MRFFEAIQAVYFDDLDGFQILHNARYLLLFERTIGAFWQRLGYTGNFATDANRDQVHLVRSNAIEYLRPVDGVGELRVRVWVEKLGRSSLVLAFRVLPMDQDVDFATGTRAIVHIELPSRTPTPWSDDFRARVAPYVKSE